MENDLIRIREEAQQKLAAMREECDLVALQQQLFGKAGELTGILRTMGKLSKEERAQLGASVNKLKQELEAAMEERRAEFRKKAQELRFQQEALDVTEAGVSPVAMGHLHPMTKTYRTIRDALVGMGFQVFDGPEIELDDNNFTLLNLPLDHPARDMQDTFYINDKVLLRTHTSPCEIRALQTFKPPFRFLMPGRVFRVDEVDASHSPVFMQIEGFVVDRNLNLANLKGTLDAFIHAVFGENVKTRLRPSYFPFTEHGAFRRARHELHHLRRQGLPGVQGHGLDRDPGLRHDQPPRAGELRPRSQGVVRLRLRRGRGSGDQLEVRHLGHSLRIRERRPLPDPVLRKGGRRYETS